MGERCGLFSSGDNKQKHEEFKDSLISQKKTKKEKRVERVNSPKWLYGRDSADEKRGEK